MTGPSFLSVDMTFGRHRGRWELTADRPVLIAGPNCSGKTTLVDGLLRTIYGFRRHDRHQADLCRARTPWDGGEFRSAVELRTFAGEVLSWSRDHASDEVEVRGADGAVLFRGVANPGSGGSSDREYWELVGRIFGLRGIDDYARTAWIGQGELLDTEFGADLLRLAEGGHARLKTALDHLRGRHRALTCEPIAGGLPRLPRERRLERDRARLEETRLALAEARAALEARRDAAARREEVEAEIARLETELGVLGKRKHRLLDRARVEAELASARLRFGDLVRRREELDAVRGEVGAAEKEVAAAERAVAETGGTAPYPDDFLERLADLESCWTRRREEEGRLRRLEDAPASRAPATPVVAGIVVAGALAGTAAGVAGAARGATWGFILLVIGLLLCMAAISEAMTRWRDSRDRRREREKRETDGRAAATEIERLDGRIADFLAGIPGRDTLGPESAAERRRRFEAARQAEERLSVARRRVEEGRERVERLLRSLTAEQPTDTTADASVDGLVGGSAALLLAHAGRQVGRLEDELTKLDRAEPVADPEVGSPDAVNAPGTVRSPEAADAVAARAEDRLRELRSERDGLLVELDRAGRAEADVRRLEREAGELRRRITDCEGEVRTLRTAWDLLRDGYDAFRDHDEERLIAAVARRLDGLGEPPLGPFTAEKGLGSQVVNLMGRPLAIDSPGLSHGQRHLVLLAVRLGTADFLAEGGPAAPLIVDEPFAHLDDRHAGQVWELLSRVSARRQVIVTTQETALLDRLGAEPVIRLASERVSNPEPPVRLRGETTGPAGNGAVGRPEPSSGAAGR